MPQCLRPSIGKKPIKTRFPDYFRKKRQKKRLFSCKVLFIHNKIVYLRTSNNLKQLKMVNFQAITKEQIEIEKNDFLTYANSITEEKYQELIEKAQNGCEQSNSILEDIDGLI